MKQSSFSGLLLELRGVSSTVVLIVAVTCKALWSEILHFMDQKLS